ncbi:MAG TPA: tetratricopeptide repeat protein, partial [Gaiellales bacterium]
SKASTLLDRSLERDPGGVDATIGAGSLALSYHDFRAALRLGQRALVLSHGFSPPALAMIGDASVELGRYDQGFAAFSRLGHLRPGLVAYARLSYSRELQGDVAGATRLMRRAVDAGSGAPENTQWTRVQLATLLLKSGHTDAAAKEFRHALALLPNYARAEAGLGAVAVARGNLPLAETWYDRAASHLPLPDIVAQLGDVRAARGNAAGAKEAYALVGIENALFIRAGGNADLETALFDASHPGAMTRTAVVALARKALAFRPSVYGHDALAWALYSAGRCAQALPEAKLANRLGTVDPQLSWHLGAIAACAGDKALARTALQRALAHTPHFHPLDAPRAQRLLARLG